MSSGITLKESQLLISKKNAKILASKDEVLFIFTNTQINKEDDFIDMFETMMMWIGFLRNKEEGKILSFRENNYGEPASMLFFDFIKVSSKYFKKGSTIIYEGEKNTFKILLGKEKPKYLKKSCTWEKA